MQRAVSVALKERGINFVENLRPEWLLSPEFTRMELDFYIEDAGIAIEVQGEQHFKYVRFFHGSRDGFERMMLYDAEKKRICAMCGIELFTIQDESEIHEVLDAVASASRTTNIDRLIAAIPVGKNNRRSKDKIDHVMNTVIKITINSIKHGHDKQYLTTKRKRNLIAGLIGISANAKNISTDTITDNAEIIRIAIIMASNFIQEDPELLTVVSH